MVHNTADMEGTNIGVKQVGYGVEDGGNNKSFPPRIHLFRVGISHQDLKTVGTHCYCVFITSGLLSEWKESKKHMCA
jgi:hypothetical protein